VLSYRASPGTVYVAADSRLTSSAVSPASSTRPPSESTCKIRILNDGVVFVGTGNALFSADRVRTNIYAVAARAAATLPRGPLQAGEIQKLALTWQATIHRRLQALLDSQGEARPLTEAAISATGTTGSFYAAVAGGEVFGITVRVGLDGRGVVEDIREPQQLSGYLVATGTNEAKQQALAIAAAPQDSQLAWPGKLSAIESQTIRVEAARYGRHSDIGGAIDVIEIAPSGPVWLAHKPSCH